MTGIEELQEINFCEAASADFNYISKNQVPEKRRHISKQLFKKDYLIYALQNAQKNQNNVIQTWHTEKYLQNPVFINKKSSY